MAGPVPLRGQRLLVRRVWVQALDHTTHMEQPVAIRYRWTADARPRHFQWSSRQILVQRPVETLAAVVAVEAGHGKGHLTFELAHLAAVVTILIKDARLVQPVLTHG